ncbi:MAG: 4'-phosphopantetheinyl transferase superfamily protein [Myxococcales bacterium]
MALRPEIAGLFPPWVRGQELSQPAQAEPLYPEEEASLARAVEKRRHEFALGRTAARHALAQLGLPASPLLPNSDRSVAWPERVWGSITHTDGLCVAVAAARTEARGIGVDVELRRRVEPKLWRMIATDQEQARIAAAGDEPAQLEHATLLFSAKEAFYKAQYCVSRSWVGFHDAEVNFTGPSEFEVRLLNEVADHFASGTLFRGKYALLERHAVTALVIASR